MPDPPSIKKKIRWPIYLPWLHIAGATLVIVFSALFSAIHSPLGADISSGESPGFAWIRAHITLLLGLGTGYLILVGWFQLKQIRRSTFADTKWVSISLFLEVLSGMGIAPLFAVQNTRFLTWACSILMISILAQSVAAFWDSRRYAPDKPVAVFQLPLTSAGLFLLLLFLIGAVTAYIEPSWHRSADQIQLDSKVAYLLRDAFAPILSGVTNLWFGIGMLIVLLGFNRLLLRCCKDKSSQQLCYFLMFFTLVAMFMAFLFLTLFYAIAWQINNLQLKLTVWQLVIFLSVVGGIVFTMVFNKIVAHMPHPQQRSLVGIASLTFGATLLFPLTWLLTVRRLERTIWPALLISTLGACFIIGYAVLFGDLFNPWFTTFSYLKGAILKILSVVAAGTGVWLLERFFSFSPVSGTHFHRLAATLAITAAVGLFPFYALEKYPEVKVAVLQPNELTRVDTTFAREVVNVLGLGRWIHLGQRPGQNGNPHPWPDPWEVKKTHASLLPDNFNLLFIVVDALRGDAFHSAGYHRDLTPFLDRWAKEEAISFRRAYSQGGGTFAAFPFLVAGRSRFDLYGPDLYQQNLYFKIAQAEGIQQYMVMQGFGPRNIYPPDFPVTELTIPHAVSDRRSATADEVFESAQNAIGALRPGERFLSFLHLMDVHNDLWKKKDGVDFGDTPRDLYDNNLSYIDRAFSRFVSWLKQKGVYDRTVILLTSDHGEQFWEHGASLHGHTLYEEEIRVPLILVTHGAKKRFEEVPAIAADMAPTVADMAGYSVTPSYDDASMGISLLPLIKGTQRRPYLKRDVVGRASFKRRYFLYHHWKWKFIFFAELDLLQLFNVIEDPMEKKNLIHERPDLSIKLEQKLMGYLERVEGRTYRRLLSNTRRQTGATRQ